MKEEFEPDIVFDNRQEFTQFFHVYLDDVRQTRCLEVRAKWESFERPAFGELIVGATRPGQEIVSSLLSKPRIGEFRDGNLLVKSVTGLVYIDVMPEGREEVRQFIEMVKESSARQ